MNGIIFSIEEFSVFDGPGIRTSVFLKGCPLRCTWCHNPEGQSPKAEIVKSPNGCVGCGECIKTAEQKNGIYLYSNESIARCPMGLLRNCGEVMSSDKLCEKLMQNKRILNNGGGVTFSGGEPLMQSEFVFECIRKIDKRLHTAIQTCGYCDERVFANALESADYFLYDLKLIDDDMHKKYTGVSNGKILANFKTLAASDKDFVIRIPLIPSVTDTESNIEEIAKMLCENNVNYVELLPYNKMAGGKYKMVQKEYNPLFDESIEVNLRKEIFEKWGIKSKVM